MNTIASATSPVEALIVVVLALFGVAGIIVWPIWRHINRTRQMRAGPTR
jgi:hypothetical protein